MPLITCWPFVGERGLLCVACNRKLAGNATAVDIGPQGVERVLGRVAPVVPGRSRPPGAPRAARSPLDPMHHSCQAACGHATLFGRLYIRASQTARSARRPAPGGSPRRRGAKRRSGSARPPQVLTPIFELDSFFRGGVLRNTLPALGRPQCLSLSLLSCSRNDNTGAAARPSHDRRRPSASGSAPAVRSVVPGSNAVVPVDVSSPPGTSAWLSTATVSRPVTHSRSDLPSP
jgi:hypothetical protein